MNEYYSAKIIFGDQNLSTIERKVLMVVDADANKGEVTYKIKKNKKGALVLRYFSFTPAAKVTPPPPSVAVVQYNTTPLPVISFGTNISSTTTSISTSTNTTGTSSPDRVSAEINLGGMSIGANVQVDDNYNSNTTISSTTTTTTTNHNQIVGQSSGFVEEEACLPMNSSSFLYAKNL